MILLMIWRFTSPLVNLYIVSLKGLMQQVPTLHFFLLHAAKVRSSCEEGPGQSALQSAYHNPKLDVSELKQNRSRFQHSTLKVEGEMGAPTHEYPLGTILAIYFLSVTGRTSSPLTSGLEAVRWHGDIKIAAIVHTAADWEDAKTLLARLENVVVEAESKQGAVVWSSGHRISSSHPD